MPNCVLRYCSNNSRNVNKTDEGITFHRFPRPGNVKREEWIEFVQIDRSEPFWLPGPCSCLCSVHFPPSDYHHTTTGRRYLKKTAMPLKNPMDESSPKKTAEKKLLKEGNPSNQDESNNIYLCTCDSDAEVEPEPEPLIKIEPLIKNRMLKKTYNKRNQSLLQRRKYFKNRIRKLTDVVKKLKSKFHSESLIENEDTLLKQANFIEKYIKEYQKFKQPGKEISRLSCVRKFALTLFYYSESAYKYVRKICNNILPHPQELRRGYGSFNGEPGFSEEAFKALWLKSNSCFRENPMICCLVYGDIAVRQEKLFRNEKLGYVNFGAGSQDEKATHVLVFMLISLTENWKIPIGYFLTNRTSAETKATLIKICLGKCHKVGAKVVSLTFDGSKTNLVAVEALGCKFSDVANMKTHFYHPYTFENVYVFVDPSYTIKKIRNAFEDKRIIFDENKEMVKWQLLVDLNKIQHNKEFRFVNIRSPKHIQFRNQIMKVKLATQTLSVSLAKSLEFCGDTLELPQFSGRAGTDRFIALINSFSNVFNSQTCNHQSTIYSSNKDKIFEQLNEVESYITSLQIEVEQHRIVTQPNQDPRITTHIMRKSVTESQFRTGFIAAIICIKSLKNMYLEMVSEKQWMSNISIHKLSQDHLQLFLGCIRNHSTKDPNAVQFREEYKKAMNYLELRSLFTWNCLPIDNFAISSTNSVSVINSTSGSNRHEIIEFQVYDKDDRPLNSDIEANVNCTILSEILNNESLVGTSNLIVGYISGYVTRELIRSITCEECVINLTSDRKLWYHKLITLKDMGGLCYSSKNVFQVCLKTESYIRHMLRVNDREAIHLNKSNRTYLVARTLEEFIDTDVFRSMSLHSFQQPATFNHRTHLIRAIIEQYSSIRMGKEIGALFHVPYQPKRRRLTKLVLFERN